MFIELHYKKVEGNPAFLMNSDYIVAIDTLDDGAVALTVVWGNNSETTTVVESYEEITTKLSVI